MSADTSEPDVARRGIALPGIMIGVGLGGFVDGIVLHQILQWHHLIGSVRPPNALADLRANVVADGLFHAVTWLAVALGVALLWTSVRGGRPWTWRSLLGHVLAGWGIFNLVEGVVDHHVLGIHRVRPGAAEPLVWDLGFLALGAALLVGGWWLARSDSRRPGAARADGRAIASSR